MKRNKPGSKTLFSAYKNNSHFKGKENETKKTEGKETQKSFHPKKSREYHTREDSGK
jgi:hypothetical protein